MSGWMRKDGGHECRGRDRRFGVWPHCSGCGRRMKCARSGGWPRDPCGYGLDGIEGRGSRIAYIIVLYIEMYVVMMCLVFLFFFFF